MPISAYIFFLIKLGKTQEVIDKLRDIPNIISVAIVTGEFDIVAKIIVDDMEQLYLITSNQIHMIEGIIETQTSVIEREEIKE